MPLSSRLLATLSCVVFLFGSSIAPGADPNDNMLSSAISAWRSGQLDHADDVLAELIPRADRDPRPLYLKGIIAEARGGDGSAAFSQAADLEASLGQTRLVNRLLESVQGNVRAKIESSRQAARVRMKPDPVAARSSIAYADGLAAMNRGMLAEALDAFDSAIADGSEDARVYYMRGVVLARMGEVEDARKAFREGLKRETTGEQVRLVSSALQDVQGGIRQMIEQEVTVAQENGSLSRQENRQIVMRNEAALQQELLLADDERRDQLMAQIDAAQRERERLAAQEFMAKEEEAASISSTLEDSGDSSPIPDPTPQPVVEAPTSVANPFGGTTTSPTGSAVPPPANVAEAESSPVSLFNPGGEASSGGSTGVAAPDAVDVSWLSPQSELVVYVRPGDFVNSGFMQPIMSTPQAQGAISQMTANGGLRPQDIQSVTVGLGNVMAVAMQAGMAAQAGGGNVDGQALAQQLMEGGNGIAVVRLNTAFDFAPLANAAGGETIEYGGQTFFKMPAEGGGPVIGVYPVDSTTLVAGTEASLQSAIDRGPGSASNPAFGFVSGKSHVAIAFASPMMGIMSGSMPDDPSAPQFVQDLTAAIRGKIAGSGLTITAGEDLTIASVMNLIDADSAAAAAQALEGAVAQGQQMFPAVRASVPEPLQPVADDAVSSLSASSDGTMASISVTIPASLVSTLQQNPDILGQLMMMGAGLAPPGAGGGPPGSFGPPQGGSGFPAEGPPGGRPQGQ